MEQVAHSLPERSPKKRLIRSDAAPPGPFPSFMLASITLDNLEPVGDDDLPPHCVVAYPTDTAEMVALVSYREGREFERRLIRLARVTKQLVRRMLAAAA